MLDTATLSTRTHLAQKPSQNTLNHVEREVIQGHAFWDHCKAEAIRRKGLNVSVFENPTAIRRPMIAMEPLRISVQTLDYISGN